MATRTQKRNKVEVIEVNGESWKAEDLAAATNLSVDTVKTTPPEALAGILDHKRKADKAQAELLEKEKKSKAAPRPRKAKEPKPTTRANKARKLIEDPFQEEDPAWTELLMEALVEDPTRSCTELHSLIGYHYIKETNAFTPEVNGAKRVLGTLYRNGLLDAEMERRIALYISETK